MVDLLIATSNRGKLREMQALTAHLDVRCLTLADFPKVPEPIEDGETFEANARKKALHYAHAAGCWAIADDSGLVVDVLDGAPGVNSARYSGTGDDRQNNRKLIAALADVALERRTARFVCCAVLANPAGVQAVASGQIEGLIVDDPRGDNGFGYDPHFYLPDLKVTTAELPPEHKNRISHRGQALAALLPEIERLVV